jgi:hypothetical protein
LHTFFPEIKIWHGFNISHFPMGWKPHQEFA